MTGGHTSKKLIKYKQKYYYIKDIYNFLMYSMILLYYTGLSCCISINRVLKINLNIV